MRDRRQRGRPRLCDPGDRRHERRRDALDDDARDAIAEIEAGRRLFVESAQGVRAFLVVATSAQGHRYVRTTSDDETTNNLGQLPRCP